MDLKRLRYFVCIGELGSFTQAARRLGIAQPALSRYVRQLEAECGGPLFHRNGRGAQLTGVGHFLFEQSRSLLDQVDRLQSDLMASRGAPAGTVVLGMPPSVCAILVEPLFHRVRQAFPGIRLHICEGFSGDVREWLVAGRLDIGILYDSGSPQNVIGRRLLVEDMFLCCAATSDETEGRDDSTIMLADAVKRPLVLPGRRHGLRILVDRACEEAGLSLNVVLELDSMETIKILLRGADIATILPYCGVHREVEHGELAAHRIVASSIARTLIAAETTRRPKTPATAAVVHCLREEIDRLVATGRWTGSARHNIDDIAVRPI